MTRAPRAVAAFAAAAVAGCAWPGAERCADLDLAPGRRAACRVDGWVDRGLYLHVPDGWDGVTPAPAILLLHGAGGSRQGADATTCPDGDEASPDCLAALATAAGYAVIVPDGTGMRPLRQLRAWNAGGGGALACIAPSACAEGVDDLAYLEDVLAEVDAAVPLDPARRYATGLSNGAAMSHRLACERPALLAAIATVGGQNQHADAGGPCDAQVPVLDVHGVDDPVWPYEGGASATLPDRVGFTSVAATLEGWRARNGCDAAFSDEALPDRDPDDGTTVVRRTWGGCAAATVHLAIAGGGHTWPGGDPYLDEATVGRVSRDVGSEVILAFFEAHARP